MRVVRRSLLVLLLVLLIALTAVYWWQRPMILTGTGYAAHNACALTHVAGRDDPGADLPPNPLVPVLRTTTDGDETTGSLLGVLARQHAYYTAGFGCTLAQERPDLPDPTPVDPGRNPLSTAPTPEESPEVAAALDAAFGTDLAPSEAAELNTRAVIALRHGDLIAERYGDGFDADTPQLGWSMAKSATSLMTGMLVQQGEIDLAEDHLVTHWTDERADITVEHLLRMTSGLAWDETYDLGTPITRMLYLETDMGGYVAAQEAAYAPGTHQQYSSGSTTLLCDVLAARTGLGADLPRATLFAPLGLASAVMEPDAAGTPVCSSYLWATPRDWAALGQFALQEGRWQGEQLLPPDWMERSLRVEPVEATDDPGYGMGWRTNRLPDGTLRWPDLPEDAYSANGHDGQEMIVVPSAELVVLRMGFTPEREDIGTADLTRRLIDATD